jgi:hypothetical protein
LPRFVSDGDQNLSKKEFVKGEQYLSLLKSINFKDDNFDLVLSKSELVNWLEEMQVAKPEKAADAAIGKFKLNVGGRQSV